MAPRRARSRAPSVRTVSIPTGKPIDVSAVASFFRLFDTQTRGRIGSPKVSGSTNRRNASRSPGSSSPSACRPPPLRRMRPIGNGAASKSSSPRLIVERASPVISETTASLPRPAARTSAAANNRRPRSSNSLPNTSHRTRIAAKSIIQATYTTNSSEGIPLPSPAIRLFSEVSLARANLSGRAPPVFVTRSSGQRKSLNHGNSWSWRGHFA